MPVTVYTPGCWDLLHVGHLNFLKQARSLGSYLVVGVAADEVIEEDKGRLPTIPLRDRLTLLSALRAVDNAVPYYKLDFIEHIAIYHPTILAVGEDWGKERRHILAQHLVEEQGGRLVKLPRTPNVSTTLIEEAILAAHKHKE